MSDRLTHGPDRLPPIPAGQWDSAQQQAAAALIATARGEVRGPFVPLLRSPELLDRAQSLGEYLRYRCRVPEPLREYAILIAARHWQQNYEWAMHAPLAQRSGVPAALIQALLNDTDRDPSGYASWPEYETVHRFALQLLVEHGVDDATYADARQLLGEAGVIDLCGLLGYYSLLAMVMNVARTPAPAGRNGPF